MVWKSVISDVGIKFDTPLGWSQGEIKVASTLINQWEELTFDFSNFVNPPADQGVLGRIIVFPDFNLSGRTQNNIIYFDNITFNAKGEPSTEPTVAAPTPTRNASDVISLFSDAYPDVPVDTWRTSWSSATFEDITVQGNAMKKYSQLDFVGIETVANQLNINEMTHFHIDVWSADFTFFGVKLVDFGADGAFGGGDDVEHQVNFMAPARGQWLSLDIPLSEFIGLTTKANLAQYILVGQPTGANTIYVDNLYFFKEMGTSANDPNLKQQRVKVFPNPVNIGEQVQLDAVATHIEVFDLAGQRIRSLRNTSVISTAGINPSGIYIVKMRLSDGSIQVEKLILN